MVKVAVGGMRLRGEAAEAVEAADVEALDYKPRSVFELMTRQMLEQVKADVGEVKQRVNTLLWLVVGAMLLDLLMRVIR